ncbi:MAG: hypothetical protein ACPG5T_09405, partial [Endozoicomonas sp.]
LRWQQMGLKISFCSVNRTNHYSPHKTEFLSSIFCHPHYGRYSRTASWENREVTEEDAALIQPPFSDTAWLDIEELFTKNNSFKTTVLRFSELIVGEYQPGRYFSGKELGGADDPVNMIHREDCILIIEQIILLNVFGETFNASADEHPTCRQLYTRSCELMGIAPFRLSKRPCLIGGLTAIS